jgi:hypothetical protein
MFRTIFALSALALTAGSASASTYSATTAAQTTGRIVARDISWNCAGNACRGSTQESRPVVLCQSLAKRAGKIDSFLVDGRPLSAGDLDRCNAAAAKAQPAKALASQ